MNCPKCGREMEEDDQGYDCNSCMRYFSHMAMDTLYNMRSEEEKKLYEKLKKAHETAGKLLKEYESLEYKEYSAHHRALFMDIEEFFEGISYE